MDTKQQTSKFEFWQLLLLIPLAAVLTPALAAICSGVPIGPALLIGIPLGLGAVILFTATSGNDLTDLIVSSVIVIILSAILTPVFMQARRRSLAAREKANITRPATPYAFTSPRQGR